MENITYICVNYDSSAILDVSLKSWRDAAPEINLIVVDNYSSDKERAAVNDICRKHQAYLIESENNGYGSGLNRGVGHIINSSVSSDEAHYIFFGNVDVVPSGKIGNFNVYGAVPILNIATLGKNENPFLNTCQAKFIWIMCIAARLESQFLLYLWLVIQKCLKRICRNVAAVHGSLFCLEIRQAKILHPIFDERVFLYCEELFFMRKVRNHKLDYVETSLNFEHFGSVSTGKTIKKNKKEFFLNWAKSMRAYCEK